MRKSQAMYGVPTTRRICTLNWVDGGVHGWHRVIGSRIVHIHQSGHPSLFTNEQCTLSGARAQSPHWNALSSSNCSQRVAPLTPNNGYLRLRSAMGKLAHINIRFSLCTFAGLRKCRTWLDPPSDKKQSLEAPSGGSIRILPHQSK